MATVMIDFDSTLCPHESFDMVCEEAGRLDVLPFLKQVCHMAMEGTISFEESVKKRLSAFRPHRDTFFKVGSALAYQLTRGLPELMNELRKNKHTVMVVSGGFKDLIIKSVHPHGFSEYDVFAVSVEYDADGLLVGIIEDGFHISKPVGLANLGCSFDGPLIIVGDGSNDLALKDAGVVDHFIAYTEHAYRDSIVKKADSVATNVDSLKSILKKLI